MATTTRALDSEILASTLDHSNREVKDALYQSSKCLDYVKRSIGELTYDGGNEIVGAVDLVEHATGTRLDNQPYATLNTTVRSNLRPPIYAPAGGKYVVAMSGQERKRNSGKAKLIDLWSSKMHNATSMAMRHWQQRFLAGLVPAGSMMGGWTTINGEDVTTGFLEVAAVGSQDNVVGGLSKATYAAVPGWQNQRSNLGNLFGTNGLNGMQSLKVRAVDASPWGDDAMVWVMSIQGKINLKRSVQPQEFYMGKDALDAGRPVEIYAGLEILESGFMPVSTATGGSATNTNPFTVFLWNAHGIYPKFYKGEAGDGYFGVGDVMPASGEQDVDVCHISVDGQTICDHLGSQGLGYAGESY